MRVDALLCFVCSQTYEHLKTLLEERGWVGRTVREASASIVCVNERMQIRATYAIDAEAGTVTLSGLTKRHENVLFESFVGRPHETHFRCVM